MRFYLSGFIYDTDKAELLWESGDRGAKFYDHTIPNSLKISFYKMPRNTNVTFTDRRYFWVSADQSISPREGAMPRHEGQIMAESSLRIDAASMTETDARHKLAQYVGLDQALSIIPAPEA